MWKSIKKGLSLIGQSLGVVVVAAFAIAIFVVILPEFTGLGAFLWGIGGLVALICAFLGVWVIGEENEK